MDRHQDIRASKHPVSFPANDGAANAGHALSRRAALQLAAAALAAAAAPGAARARPAVAQVVDHPRLWLTAADLPRLRGWANEANPIWVDGVLVRAAFAVETMDAGLVPGEDLGGTAWDPYPVENYAALFAFLSLVHPDEAARADYTERARSLLMFAITAAAEGPAPGEPFRDPEFSTRDRSRWSGECFMLTVDWIYPSLTTEDKALIRAVFLRWIEENTTAAVTGANDHPQPVGVVNDPVLVSDPLVTRWAGNNYFLAHMRNIGLMAMALDPADDPDGAVTGALEGATGAWLYMADHLLRGDARGGLAAEGFEYSPQAIGYIAQFLLALHTAGRADPATAGPQVVFPDNPYWDEVVPGYLHSISPLPAPDLIPDWEWMGTVYQPAWYGDGARYWAPDMIGLFGPLGRYDDLTGNVTRLDALRWIQTHLAPGREERLLERVAEGETFTDAIHYFLLFDPEAPVAADPRPSLPLSHFSAGLGRYLHRTSWDDDATMFTYSLAWNTVDHQHNDGNQFELYRGGEWLTKERTGYGFNIGCSDYHNTLGLENDQPTRYAPGDYTAIVWERGSQWPYIGDGDPVILASSVSQNHVYFLGEAVNLYNSTYEEATDLLYANRSIVWLPPDHIVIYDRAASQTDGRFKRFWLNLPATAEVAGNVSTMTTVTGQHLVVTTLLPVDAAISAEPAEPLLEENEPALGEPMQFRLRVEAPGGPATARFLHVLQGADAGETADLATLIESEAGTPFVGVAANATVVLFPVDLGDGAVDFTYRAPAGVTRHLVTGLASGATYDIEMAAVDGAQVVTVRTGASQRADDGGVLILPGIG